MLEHIQKLEEQFEEAQDRISDRCERLISDFFTESLDLPREIKKYAQIGMRYENFIDRFKSKISLNEYGVSGEAKELLQIAKAEILNLRSNIKKAKADTLETKKDVQIFERQLYACREIDTLKTDKQKRKAKRLTESGDLPKYKISEIIAGIKNEN